jgi:chemotaxis-related protein WspB
MLCLLLHLEKSVFALPCGPVVRIVPKVPLQALPQAPLCIAGLMHYRGGSVPVIDLSALIFGRAASERLSSRIILMNYQPPSGPSRVLGILAEGVMETVDLDQNNLKHSGINLPSSPYLGQVASTDLGLIQLLDSQQLVPESMKERLFPQT